MSLSGGYRGVTAVGTVLLALAVGLLASTLTNDSTGTSSLTIALLGGAVGVALAPLYVPRSRSVAMLIGRTGRQVAIACLALVTLNVGGIAAVPSIATTLMAGGILTVVLPVWYQLCRHHVDSQQMLVVGDQPALLKSVIRSLPNTPFGFLSPVLSESALQITELEERIENDDNETGPVLTTDGGITAGSRVDTIDGVERLDGLSQLEHVLQEHDIDTVALAFSRADREECFGVLRTCHEYGVNALVHESLAKQVLQREQVGNELVRVDLEPWSWYSRATKRAFDLVFATTGLLALAPLILIISVMIKLDSSGPVLYKQTRSSILGETFTVAKFRSMVTDAESDGAQLSEEDAGGVDPRVTGVGRILRRTHLDEIPQLFSVLTGEMSIVGPRPERPELDREIEAEGIAWTKRWFVKPGLTGIAQVNDVTGFEPEKKLAYDLEYARRQSFRLDVTLIALQIWSIVKDVGNLVSNRLSSNVEDNPSK